MQYCRSCFGVSPGCQCSAVPRQVSGPTAALWALPTLSYSAMVSSTETTASTSTAGVTPPSHLPPRDPAIELMDTLPPLTTENLLATAGIGRGRKRQTPPRIPTASGLRQMRPKTPQQQAPAPGGRKRHRQHLIGNRCSHLSALPPNRAPPPVPARIREARLGKPEAPGVGPRPEGLRIGEEGVGPPPEDLRSADGLIPMTV